MITNRKKGENIARYIDLLLILLDLGYESDFISNPKSFPHIPEVMAIADETSKQIYADALHEVKGDSHEIFFIAHVWSTLAGIGSVMCMGDDPQSVRREGTYAALMSSRGFNGMDDFVLERMEIRDGQEKKALLSHLGLIGQILAHEIECKDPTDREIQITETMKAAFVYGMILQINREKELINQKAFHPIHPE